MTTVTLNIAIPDCIFKITFLYSVKQFIEVFSAKDLLIKSLIIEMYFKILLIKSLIVKYVCLLRC